MRTGDRAIVVFEFCQRPSVLHSRSEVFLSNNVSREFLTIHEKLLFREGRTKGLGLVTALGYDKAKFAHAAEESEVKE